MDSCRNKEKVPVKEELNHIYGTPVQNKCTHRSVDFKIRFTLQKICQCVCVIYDTLLAAWKARVN